MKILVTGAKGFIGKNLIIELKNRNYTDIYEYDIDSDSTSLDSYCQDAQFVFHLAGVNRPVNNAEFMEGNFGFTSTLLDTLKKHQNIAPVMLSSSIQAERDNPYGLSKRAGEELLFKYGKETGAPILVYRFPNVFGKWCRPNYNSAIATFCHNIARNLPITVNDESVNLNLVYIDDVVSELIDAMEGRGHRQGENYVVPTAYQVRLGHIVDLIKSFKMTRTNQFIPDMEDEFTKKLYSTYLSYLPSDQFAYELNMHSDERGSFTEFLKSPDRGQVSVNVTKPGITKGNHWHHSKNEKFLVVFGKAMIRFRKIDSNQVIEYQVSGDKLEVVDIPVGYTHNIENIGDTDLVTIMWANEPFDKDKPDTFHLKV